MEVKEIEVKKIKIKKQARHDFDEDKIISLADSMQEVGQLQPVIVKKDGLDFLLIAGERRLRAVKKNKLDKIAAIILDEDIDNSMLKQIQLIENIQRQDLNPLERALGIQRLIEENGYTKKEASQKLGVARTTLSEWLNILDVKKKYQKAVLDEDSSLSLSHITLAKALASRTGNPGRLNELLDGVLQHKFTREETKEVVEIIYRYLHIPTEEAFDAILLRREHKKRLLEREKDDARSSGENPAKLLVNSFTNLSSRLEGLIERVEMLNEKEKKNIIDEFLYIYQMLGIMVPEIKKDELDDLLKMLREN
ncbi:ParB/RepB/Spo0J family partition protein [Natronospora cellulosivora (SeqCode)]